MREIIGSFKWALLILSILMWIPIDAAAIPLDGPPSNQLEQAKEGKILLSQRRRRRRRRPRKRPRPKSTPKPAAATPAPAPAPAPSPDNLRRGGRVEFDGRLVQGQTAKSGAIYLFARQRTDLQSMVRERTNYRKEILRTVTSYWVKEK